VIDLVQNAGISICSNPHISLVVGGRYDPEPIPRATTRVKQLWQAGVNLFSGQDDVNDPYYPFGRNDQQEVASYVCHSEHMTYPHEVRAVFDFITANGAKALRLENYGIDVGASADLNVLVGSDVRHVIRRQQPPRYVIAGGKVLAENERKATFDASVERV
jgi:cytosine/creatinine deaminase